MKPTFALDLTGDTVALLHRTPKGWLPIGETTFDAPDLAEALDYLRKTALGLSPMGVATKLILPNSQILYAEIHAPGPSRDEKRRQIATALEGRTPYEVGDLVFDWSGKGATVKVAVIAKETLDQAEAFAVEHRLNPVSFVAIPEEGTFVGEPWFGPSAASASLLAEDEVVERDRDPVQILHRELPKTEPLPPPVEPAPVAATAPGEDDPLPGLEEALNAELPEAAEPTAVADYQPLTADIDDTAEADPVESEPIAIGTADDGVVRSFAETMAEMADPDPDPAAEAEVEPEPTPAPPAEVEEAPFAHVTDTAAFPEPDAAPPTTRVLVADTLDDDLPPAPPSAAMVAFATRRSAPPAPAGRAFDGVTKSGPTGRGTGPVPRPVAPAKGSQGLVTAPSIPGTRAKARTKSVDIPRPVGLGPTTVKSPSRPGGTFGAAAPTRKRTGVVFMVLVALLLLFLALVGAWSSLYLGGTSPATTEGADATEVLPDVGDEMLADMQDPEGMTDPLPEAAGAPLADAGALATEGLPVNMGGDPAVEDAARPSIVAGITTEPSATLPDAEMAEVEPEAAPVAAPEPAPETAVATEVSAGTPPVEDQDEIFLSAMDAPPPALDALGLPALVETRDTAPDPVMPPPAPGTVYKFDANGLLMPTPEGIISPDGVMLIAGKPPILPPSRSEVVTAAALAAAALSASPTPATDGVTASDASLVTGGGIAPAALDAAPADPADPAMAGFRPRPRPESLTPATGDDAALAAAPATDFAGLRPLPRPASVLAAATAARPAAPADLGAQGASLTAQAEAQLAAAAALEAQNPSVVAISKRPEGRPADLSRAVEAAVAAAVREPAPEAEVVEVAAAAPEAKPDEVDELDEPETASAAPSIPTKASVAKQATYVNAINLSKINLIGTYGTDSRRYALVRQANGKYKKVKVGDKIDGGTVKAITDTEVRYQKGGRLISLKMPKI